METAWLPFERRFWKWIDDNGMGRERFPLDLDGAESTTAYRLMPVGRAARIVLAIHGAGNDALFGWVGLFKRLLLAGSGILTLDLPGHGRFNRGSFSRDAGRAAVSAAIAECRRWRAATPIHAVGVSLGGAMLLEALAEPGVKLASAAILVAPLRIELSPRSFAGELRPHNFAIVASQRAHYGATGLIPSFGPFKRDTYPLRLADRPPPGAFGYVDTLNANLVAMALEDAAARVRTPTLLVYGARDRIVPSWQGERLASLLPGSVLEIIPSGSHLSTPLEPAAEDHVVRWIEKHQ